MNCTCISRIEKKITAHLLENGKFKKPVKSVRMDGTVMTFEKNAVTRTANFINIELEGQKKLERMSMIHTFCPFCGVKQEPEA